MKQILQSLRWNNNSRHDNSSRLEKEKTFIFWVGFRFILSFIISGLYHNNSSIFGTKKPLSIPLKFHVFLLKLLKIKLPKVLNIQMNGIFFNFILPKNIVPNWNKKNLLASLAHSHRALRAQLARMSAPRARDLMVVALRAPTYVNFALRSA